MKNVFRFKQFEVNQHGCSMRINTDGVLLGAMAEIAEGQPERILDIGTGTGVIALMLAQRFEQAQVDAIDIDEGSYHCSKLNFQSSIFAGRMGILHVGIENYGGVERYDLIVSNPPFFIDSLKNSDDRKTLSRHGSLFFYESLFTKADQLLTDDGSFLVIWPIAVRDRVVNLNYLGGLRIYREVFIQSFPESEPFRVISFLNKEESAEYAKEFFSIYQEQNMHSDAYVELLKHFFLNF